MRVAVIAACLCLATFAQAQDLFSSGNAGTGSIDSLSSFNNGMQGTTRMQTTAMNGMNNMGMNGMNGMGMQTTGMGMQTTGMGMQTTGMGMQNGFGTTGNINGVNVADPTSMGTLNQMNTLNGLGFDPRQTNSLFQDQLATQNGMTGQFGQTMMPGQMSGMDMGMTGMGMPMGMPMPSPFGMPFPAPGFFRRPGAFGPFRDPFMNAFAPRPFMQGPMFFPGMTGMEATGPIFDSTGRIVGSTGGSFPMMPGSGMMTSFGNNGMSGMANTFAPMNGMTGMSGMSMDTTGFPSAFDQTNTFGQATGSSIGGRPLGVPGAGGVGVAGTVRPGMPRVGGVNLPATVGTQGNLRAGNAMLPSGTNSFALNNNGAPIATKTVPFNGIVPTRTNGGGVSGVGTQRVQGNANMPLAGMTGAAGSQFTVATGSQFPGAAGSQITGVAGSQITGAAGSQFAGNSALSGGASLGNTGAANTMGATGSIGAAGNTMGASGTIGAAGSMGSTGTMGAASTMNSFGQSGVGNAAGTSVFSGTASGSGTSSLSSFLSSSGNNAIGLSG